MRPTVEAQLRSRGVEEKDFSRFINFELIPLLRQVRQGLNAINRSSATIATDGSGTPTTAWTSADLPVGSAVTIKAHVTARSVADRSGFEKIALFYNQGTVVQEGVTATIWSENAGGLNVQFSIVSNHVELVLTDPGGNPYNWVAVVDTLEVTS